MTAEEVVFGTFWTKAGTITAIDPQTREITIQEVGTKKPLVVKVATESKLKMLPSMHMAEGSGPSHGGPPEHVPTTPSGAVDIAKILSNMPVCQMDDLKIGGAVLVSSTKGATEGRVTAIMLLANAEMFVELMQQQAEGNGAGMEQFLKASWNESVAGHESCRPFFNSRREISMGRWLILIGLLECLERVPSGTRANPGACGAW